MWNSDESLVNRVILWGSAVLVLGAAAGLYYYYQVRQPDEAPAVAATPTPAPEPQPSGPPAEESPPPIENPVPASPPEEEVEPLPPLKESDAAAKETVAELFGKQTVDKLLTPENIVRRIVVTVDNLPRKKVSMEVRAARALPGETIVIEQGDTITLSPENYARYKPYVKLLQSVEPKQLAKVYFRWYPLFQDAYEDLGYPGHYFNDRLVQVIDHLLETPTVRGPILLTRPKVFYEFADPDLEARSAGQKVLIRMGPENANEVKRVLRALREELVSGREPPKAADPPPASQ